MLGHPPYHHQQPAATSSQSATVNPPDTHTPHPQPPGTFQTLRLRDDPPTVTHSRPSRKRKSPPSANPEPAHQQQQQQQQPPPGMHPPPPGMSHPLPPPHAMVHPSHMGAPPPLPHGYQYVPSDYTPGGMPQQQPQPQQQQQQQQPVQNAPSPSEQSPTSGGPGGRTLSQSKRAEQNRKAQRAFRERRDQHVKALESRSQLLDAALASADEANRRWEECRALVDQLRIENAALRAALSQAQMLNGSGGGGANGTAPANTSNQEQNRTGGEKPSSGGNNNRENESQEGKDAPS